MNLGNEVKGGEEETNNVSKLEEIRIEKVIEAVKILKLGKVAGHDGIRNCKEFRS